jgi:CRP-like cAMP-binding protein
MQPALQYFLGNLVALTPLTDAERGAVLSLPGTPQIVPAGKTIVAMGDRSAHSCLVVEGFCGRADACADGTHQTTALHVSGDFPDLYSVFLPKAHQSLIALSQTTILRVPHSVIREMLINYPGVAEAVTRYLLAREATTAEWVVNVGGRKAPARLAHFLCETTVRLRATQAGFFEFPLTQVQLSEIAGVSPVHANRSLRVLRELNLLAFHDAKVTILDWNGLVRMAGFDSEYLYQNEHLRFTPKAWQ